jgi:hypothetical protein
MTLNNQPVPSQAKVAEAPGQDQSIATGQQENKGSFSFLNLGALTRTAMPRIPSWVNGPPAPLQASSEQPPIVLVLLTPTHTRSRVLSFARLDSSTSLKHLFKARRPEFAPKLHGRYRTSKINGAAVAHWASKNSWAIGKMDRFVILSVNGSVKLTGASILLKEFGTCRVIRLKPLTLVKRSWKQGIFSLYRFTTYQFLHFTGLGVSRESVADPVSQKIPIPSRNQEFRPDEAHLKFDDAAKYSNRTEAELWKFASEGDINLRIMVPSGIDVLPYDTKNERKGITIYPPKMLVLDKRDCSKISSSLFLKTKQSVFKKCYVMGNNKLFLLPPRTANLDTKLEESDEWRSFKDGERYPIEISQEDIWVNKIELEFFMLENPTQIDELSPDDIFKPESYTSNKLINLDRTARHFWVKIYSENEEYPTNGGRGGVEEWLQEKYGFSRTSLAKAGASIIRPAYAKEGKPLRSEQIKRKSYMTDVFELLVEVSKQAWMNADLNEMETYLSNEDIVTLLKNAWLKKGNGTLSDHLAKAGASIIRPEKAKKGRPTIDAE